MSEEDLHPTLNHPAAWFGRLNNFEKGDLVWILYGNKISPYKITAEDTETGSNFWVWPFDPAWFKTPIPLPAQGDAIQIEWTLEPSWGSREEQTPVLVPYRDGWGRFDPALGEWRMSVRPGVTMKPQGILRWRWVAMGGVTQDSRNDAGFKYYRYWQHLNPGHMPPVPSRTERERLPPGCVPKSWPDPWPTTGGQLKGSEDLQAEIGRRFDQRVKALTEILNDHTSVELTAAISLSQHSWIMEDR